MRTPGEQISATVDTIKTALHYLIVGCLIALGFAYGFAKYGPTYSVWSDWLLAHHVAGLFWAMAAFAIFWDALWDFVAKRKRSAQERSR